VEDDEEVAVLLVVVDLRPLTLREDVLDVEGVPAEATGELLGLLVRRRVEVDPRQAAGLDLAQTPALGRRLDAFVTRTARAADTRQARHRDSEDRRSLPWPPCSPSYPALLI
jgi:hypothetical protein